MVYSTCTTPTVNCIVYSNPERTQLAPAGWYGYNVSNYFYVNNNGVITSVGSNCVTSYNLFYNPSSCGNACESGTPVTLWSFHDTLTMSAGVFSDSSLLNSAPSGYYTTGPGGTCYEVYQADWAVSLINSISTCPAACTASGTYAYSSCEYNPYLGCTSDVIYRHDGSCGYYPDYYANYYCGCY